MNNQRLASNQIERDYTGRLPGFVKQKLPRIRADHPEKRFIGRIRAA